MAEVVIVPCGQKIGGEEAIGFQMYTGVHGRVQLGHVFVLAASYTLSVITVNGTAAGSRSPNIWRPGGLQVKDGSSIF